MFHALPLSCIPPLLEGHLPLRRGYGIASSMSQDIVSGLQVVLLLSGKSFSIPGIALPLRFMPNAGLIFMYV